MHRPPTRLAFSGPLKEMTRRPHSATLITSLPQPQLCYMRSPGQTSRREARHIVRKARVQPPASSGVIQAQIAPSLSAPVSSRIIRRHFDERHLGSRRPLRVLPLTPTHRCLRLEWCRSR
ncbi:HTH_Tnp_Tc3_2 domain-containing protein [Trichonephila clavipes]|nr:HTH_Tnp_Tc3_2 domain-containing protein [Trichonephila clavipes]